MRFESFKTKCNLISKRFKKIFDQIKDVGPPETNLDSKQIQKLTCLYNEVKVKNSDILSSLDALLEDENATINETELELLTNNLSDLFIEIETLLKPIVDDVSKPKSNDNSSTSQSSNFDQNLAFSNTTSQVKLPKLQLKGFDGQISQWLAFYNLFDTTVHKNISLTDIEKFQYLLSTLSGEPLNLIKSLPFTNENYNIAYQSIVKRYHNPRVLKSLHINYLIDMEECSSINATSLRNFISKYNEHMSALVALNYEANDENPFLVTMLLRKFPNFMRTRFESKRGNPQEFPSPKEFILFLENECVIAENSILSQDNAHFVKSSSIPNTSKETKPFVKSTRKTVSANHCHNTDTQHETLCSYCGNSGHLIYRCDEFHKLDTYERFKMVKSRGLCVNCLRDHKGLCTSKKVCIYCRKRHNSLLHHQRETIDATGGKFSVNNYTQNYENKNAQLGQSSSNNFDGTNLRLDQYQESNSNATSNGLLQNSSHTTRQNNDITSYRTLLGTAMVKLRSDTGCEVLARALVDSGSSCTIINEHLANVLGVKRKFCHDMSNVTGISSVSVQTKGQCTVNIMNASGEIVANNHPVMILGKITSDLPHTDIKHEIIQKVKNFKLADPSFHKSGPVQMLIGADLFMDILKENKYSLGKNMPYLLDTTLGFVIMGKLPTSGQLDNGKLSNSITTYLTIQEDPLHKLMMKFWETEQPPSAKCQNPENVECESHFKRTHTRDENGKYTVSLPFKTDPHSQLGQSSETAKRRFLSLEKRLDCQPEYKKLYTDFMDDYLESGHMKLFDINLNYRAVLPQTHYFIPHHGVFKENSSTTKLRVVFDASSSTTSGKSLNELLCAGPKLHNDIASILINFRRHKFVFTTDIKQMFRSINLNSDDHKFQLIYWRKDPDLPLSIYQLQTVTYGMTSSPFLANRTILQLIEDEGSKYPLATAALKTQIYVDDIILGADTLHDTILLQNEVNDLFKQGGFHLRKWIANHDDLLKTIPEEFHENPVYFRTPDQPLVSVLGLHYLPKKDCFSYRIKVTDHKSLTKRSVLQDIASIYDPCGFLAPVVFFAKEFMQQLWLAGLHWDAQLPDELSEKWKIFVQDLPSLESLLYDRPLCMSGATNMQLHGFSDSSPKGMAANVYIRTVDSQGKTNVRLIIAKTRVAPLKHTSLPRLELCAAYLLSDLLDFCIKNIEGQISIDSVTAWSDSTVTLSWIKSPSYRLKTYVANRVAHIQETISPDHWRHIPSEYNPVDCATRGLYPSELINDDSWFNGPSWLYDDADNWPKSSVILKQDKIPELKTNLTNPCVDPEPEDWNLLNKFSSWTKLTRVVAFMHRFINNLKKEEKTKGVLTLDELNAAEKSIVYLVQQKSFSEDIDNLKKDKCCSQKLLRLSPFLDEDGLLRVGGRLKNAPIQYEKKHPLILPKKGHVTNLIIQYFHMKYLHAGPQLLQGLITNKFWILSGRSAIRSQVFKCITCYKHKPTILTPKMGDLPKARVTPSPPFKNTGCDYAGPFSVKVYTLRRAQIIKVYICLFVCFITKAVHIEVATDLTANAFLAALTRFVSRRGLPSDIYLDNATNFTGVSKQLKRTVKELFNKDEMKTLFSHYTLENAVKFHFIPPTASHMGGLWERSVRSIKHHLYKVVGQQILTLEEFQTLCVRIEGILNSRPLSVLSSDPSEIDVLTPGHFLIGRPMVALPETDVKEIPLNHLKRWQRVQSMSQQIWNRWQKEVLQQLQQRSKWTKGHPNVKVGDIVLVHEANVPPQMWCLGRIVETIAGADGYVRVVRLKTVKGHLTRPVVKVSPLPFCDQ